MQQSPLRSLAWERGQCHIGDKMGLNKYGELIGDEVAFVSSLTSLKPAAERKCAICRGSLGFTHTVCLVCNDSRVYCSPQCIERHHRNEHYRMVFCAYCGGKIPKTYYHNDQIDNAFGKGHCFCCKHCLYTFQDKHFCEECGHKLPGTYNVDYKINSILHRQLGFCSDYCIKKYRRERFCYACGGKLGTHYRYCTICGEDRYRFCNTLCASLHKFANH